MCAVFIIQDNKFYFNKEPCWEGRLIKCVVPWNTGSPWRGYKSRWRLRGRESRDAGKEHFKARDLGNTASLPGGIQAWWIEVDDTGIKRGGILESSLSYIKKPSKVEASQWGGEERASVYRSHWGKWRRLRGEHSSGDSGGEEWQQMLWTPWEKWVESLRSGAESREEESDGKRASGLSSLIPEGLVWKKNWATSVGECICQLRRL